MSKIMKMPKSKRLESEEEMSEIMKMPKSKRHESEEEEDWDEDDFEEEEEESKERDEFEANVVENPDPNTITVKLQKLEFGPDDLKFMKINKEIELRLLMIHYCENMRMEYRNTKFMFNGARLRNGDTPLKLSMVDGDIISVCRTKNQGVDLRGTIGYQTLCIRAHKRKDTFVRVACNEPLLRSIKRNFSDSGNGEHDSTCFFYQGEKINDTFHTADLLRIKDGDIIDAFNFDDHRLSLSFVSGLPSTLRQPPTFKGNPGIGKSGPRKNVLGTPGTRSRPRETHLHSNRAVQQRATRPWHLPVGMYESSPSYAGTKRVRY